jgi:hypothetical protein
MENQNQTIFNFGARFSFRSDTLAKWESVNPKLGKGEPGIVEFEKNEETGELTPESQERLIKGEWLKFGDGETAWIDLPWAKGPKGAQGIQGIQGIQGEKGEKGDPGKDGKDAVIDQTYNPESENAQSGIAINGAIGDIPTSAPAGKPKDLVDYINQLHNHCIARIESHDRLIGEIDVALTQIIDTQQELISRGEGL